MPKRPNLTRSVPYWWPVITLTAAGAIAYPVLARLLIKALIADGEMMGRGPSTFFLILSGVIGWAAVVLVQSRWAVTGPILWLASTLSWGTALAAGLWIATRFGVPHSVVMQLALYCILGSLIVSGATAWSRSQ